ncbi:MAG TPA: hypothetical protein VFZ44_02870 [Pyrinomonadaceae bacterium]
MKLYPAVLSTRRLARALAAAALVLSAAASGAAGQMAPAPSARRNMEAERIREQQRREMQLRKGGTEAGHPTDERAVKAAVKQLGDDFRRIQVIRNDVARALVAGGALDYGRVSEQAAEVRKRALRMQTYLALRDEKVEERQHALTAALGEEELKGALVRLCKRIDSFVANPRFKSPDVVNVEGNERAGRDLREIIALSAAVHDSAERMVRADSSAKHAGP